MSHILNEYFKNLIFTRIPGENTASSGYTIYGAGIQSGLASQKRYVLLFVKSQYATLPQAKIYELDYDNLQTRQLSQSYNLRPQNYGGTHPQGYDPLLEVLSRSDKESVYTCPDLPYWTVSLIHDPKKNTKFQYNNKITLSAALSMFNTVITINKPIITPQRYSNVTDDSFILL